MAKVKNPSKLIVRKRELLRKKILISSGVLLLFLLIVIFFFRWDKTNINDIKIEGNQAISKDELTAFVNNVIDGEYFWILPKRNFIIYPKSEIENGIKDNFKRVKNVEVRLAGMRSILIKVDERKPFGVWCSSVGEMGCYFLDNMGYIFSRAPDFSDNTYFKYSGGEADVKDPIGIMFLYSTTTEPFLKINKLIENIKTMKYTPYKLLAKDNGDCEIFFKDNGKIIFRRNHDYEKIYEDLKIIFDSNKLEDKFEYIDMRFGNKIYYK